MSDSNTDTERSPLSILREVDPDAPESTGPYSSAVESCVVQSSRRFHTVRTAAAHLGVDPETLREQCRNAADQRGVADLGGGLLGVRAGRFWRIQFPWWPGEGRGQ